VTANTTIEMAYPDDEALDRILARVYAILLEGLDDEPEQEAEASKAEAGVEA
jgi:hypothetical protein